MTDDHTFYLRDGTEGMEGATIIIRGDLYRRRGPHRLHIIEATHGADTERVLTATGWVDHQANSEWVGGDTGIEVSGAVLAALGASQNRDLEKIRELEAEVERWKQLADASARALEAVSGVMAPTRTVYPDGH